MATVRRYAGTPLTVDEDLAGLLSLVRWGVGLVGAALLACWGAWWWVPVPVVVATLVAEGILFFRSDRAIRLDVRPDRVVVEDRFGPTLTIFADRVRACVVASRPRLGGHEVVALLSGDDGPLVAVATQVDGAPPGVDIDAIDRFLGAGGGLLRSLASPPRAVRQRFSDPSVIDALRAFAPEAARATTLIRLWRGSAPELSVFGMHQGAVDATLSLAPTRWSVREGTQPRSLTVAAPTWRVSARDAVLLSEREEAEARLPVLVLSWPGLDLAFPAPSLAVDDDAPLPPSTYHTHAAEGALVLAHLATLGLAPELPTPLVRAPVADDNGAR